MKWTKTAVAWSLAAGLLATATGGLLWAQQPGAPEPSAATTAPKAELEQTNPAAGLGQPQAGVAGRNSTNLPVVAKPPSGAGSYAVQTVYAPGMILSPYGVAEADDPETAKLRQAESALAHESEQLVAQYAATEDDEQRGGLKTQLAESLSQQFSVQQQLRERELARVEARVKKLRELTEKRRAAQKTIVEQRLDQLLREADGLGWTPPVAAQGALGPNNTPSSQQAFQQYFNRAPLGLQSTPAPAAAPAAPVNVLPRR
jgi:hypothetical protein